MSLLRQMSWACASQTLFAESHSIYIWDFAPVQSAVIHSLPILHISCPSYICIVLGVVCCYVWSICLQTVSTLLLLVLDDGQSWGTLGIPKAAPSQWSVQSARGIRLSNSARSLSWFSSSIPIQESSYLPNLSACALSQKFPSKQTHIRSPLVE